MLHVVKIAIDIMAPRLGQVFENEMLTYHCKMNLWGWWLGGQGQRAEMGLFHGSLRFCFHPWFAGILRKYPIHLFVSRMQSWYELVTSSVKVHEVCSATLTSLKV